MPAPRSSIRGCARTPDYIARIAVDEDVDAVCLSILSGSHHEMVQQVLASLASFNASDIPLFVGGTIPPGERDELIALGVRRIFTSEMTLTDALASLAEAL